MKPQNSMFQFTNPSLESLSFKNNGKFVQDGPIELRTNLTTFIEHYESPAVVMIEITLGEEMDEQPFLLFLRMKALFQWEAELSREEAVTMLKTTAPALLVSYARPIIANLTGWSQHAPFNLPFIDLTQNEAEEIDA